MYELLGISLTLAALLTINTVASSMVAGSWRLLQASLRNASAQTRAEFLFALRMAPSVLALIAVTVFLIPSYIGYEPQSASEVVSKKLALIALISAASLAFALWRALRGWFATHMLLREWLTAAQPFKLPGVSVPADLRPRRRIAVDDLRHRPVGSERR